MKIILTGNKISQQIMVWQPKVIIANGNKAATMTPISPIVVWVK